jgi:hypothetical protein
MQKARRKFCLDWEHFCRGFEEGDARCPAFVDSIMPSRLETPGDTNHDIDRKRMRRFNTKQLNWQKDVMALNDLNLTWSTQNKNEIKDSRDHNVSTSHVISHRSSSS